MTQEFDFRKVDLNLLVIFEAIYASRNISQAASLLGMSQPTMSNALARLRIQLGDQLFMRLDRGVAPTTFAENIIMPVRKALAVLRDGLQPVGAFDFRNAERVFRISMHGFTSSFLLSPIVREIDEKAPGITLEVLPQDWQRPFESLLSGKVDIAIDAFPQDNTQIGFDSLYNVNAVAIVRRGHPRINGELTAEAFGAVGHAILSAGARQRLRIESALLSAGLSRRIVCEVAATSELGLVVADSDLLAIVPQRYALSIADSHGLQILPLPFATRSEMMIAGWLRQKEQDAGVSWLRARIKQAAIESERQFLPEGEARNLAARS
jgi:DNA-binding transcriptional LysR family regulator